MKASCYERMIADAKNEIGALVLTKLGGTARAAVRAANRVGRNIRRECDGLNALVESAQCGEGEL